jgi:hypothetical protein
MSRLKEIAKFACGWEAFHAVTHLYYWSENMTVGILGITVTPTVSLGGAVVNAVIALALGLYAWGLPTTASVSSSNPRVRTPV